MRDNDSILLESAYTKVIEETYFGDYYPKGFLELYNKWKKQKNDPTLYVQFTSHQGDTLDKKAYEFPNHSDPMGIYGYPLKYVIDYPADIWYGHGAKYVRILKDKSKMSLNLTAMETYRAIYLLNKMGIGDGEYVYKMVRKKFPEKRKGITSAGKIFFQAIQIDMEKSVFRGKYEKDDIVVRSAKEQTDLFRKIGVDAVKDNASTMSQAVINDREPNQIIFLTPTSFEVLETFRLSDEEGGTRTTIDVKKFKKKIAANLAEIMDDTVLTKSETSELMGWEYFWTKKGRLIKILDHDTSLNYRMKNLKMGQKIFKGFKKFDPHMYHVEIQSEKKDIKLRFEDDEKLMDFLKKFKTFWDSAENKEFEEKPYSFERHRKEKEEEKERFYREKREKENIKILSEWEIYEKKYNELMDMDGLPHMPKDLTDEEKIMLASSYGGLFLAIRTDNSEQFDKIVKLFEKYPPKLEKILKNLNNFVIKYEKYLPAAKMRNLYYMKDNMLRAMKQES